MKGIKNKENDDIYDHKMPLKNLNNYNIEY
jgi:hypothetical protein